MALHPRNRTLQDFIKFIQYKNMRNFMTQRIKDEILEMIKQELKEQ
jgi:hypothetical protein